MCPRRLPPRQRSRWHLRPWYPSRGILDAECRSGRQYLHLRTPCGLAAAWASELGLPIPLVRPLLLMAMPRTTARMGSRSRSAVSSRFTTKQLDGLSLDVAIGGGVEGVAQSRRRVGLADQRIVDDVLGAHVQIASSDDGSVDLMRP